MEEIDQKYIKAHNHVGEIPVWVTNEELSLIIDASETHSMKLFNFDQRVLMDRHEALDRGREEEAQEHLERSDELVRKRHKLGQLTTDIARIRSERRQSS